DRMTITSPRFIRAQEKVGAKLARLEIENAAARRLEARAYDLTDLQSDGFLRLLGLAHAEGLLTELLEEADHRGYLKVPPLEGLAGPKEPENQSSLSPSQD